MSPEQIERLAQEAMQRLAYFINRSAGQHLRAMRAYKSPSPATQPVRK